MGERATVAAGLRTDRSLPEQMAIIPDPARRQRKLQRRYRRESFALGGACVGTAINTLLLPKHGVQYFVASALQVRAAANNRNIIENLAMQEGFDDHAGPRKRYIFAGMCVKAALKAVTLGHEDAVQAFQGVNFILDQAHGVVHYICPLDSSLPGSWPLFARSR